MWYLNFGVVRLSRVSSNPRCIIPTVAWRNSCFRSRDGVLFQVGSLGFLWLWFEFWLSLRHSSRYPSARKDIESHFDKLREKASGS